LRRDYPREMREVSFPPKRLLGRFNPDFVEDRRVQLQQFLERTMQSPDIINSSAALRQFADIDRNVCRVPLVQWMCARAPTGGIDTISVDDLQVARAMEQEKKDLLRLVEATIKDPSKRQLLKQLQFAKALYAFEPRNDIELPLQPDCIVIVTDPRSNNGWYHVCTMRVAQFGLQSIGADCIQHQGQYQGKSGFFPANYVELLDGVPKDLHLLLAQPPPPTTTTPTPTATATPTPSVSTASTTAIASGRASSHIPDVPDPAVPRRLSAADKIRRRTLLLHKRISDDGASTPSGDGDVDGSNAITTPTQQAPPSAPAQQDASTSPPSCSSASPSATDSMDELPVPNGALVDSDGLLYINGEALYSFTGETEFELTFAKGDILQVYTIDYQVGWWQGKVHGTIGYFPGTYVKVPNYAASVLPVESET
jgi:hypothetical protein